MLPEFESAPTGAPGHAGIDQEPTAGEAVRQVAAEVLETMFFTEAVLAACEHSWIESAPCARIQFEGSHFGEMLLAVSAEAADPLAASFLGVEPDELSSAARDQVVEELSNILCGAMLSHIWPESKLALATPELAPWQEWPGESALHLCFMIPEGMLAISIRLFAAPPAARAA